MKQVEFTVLGEPRGKGRPRFTRQGRTYTDSKTREYEKHVAEEYMRYCGDYQFPPESPLAVYVTAYFGVPKSISKKKREAMLYDGSKPQKKPDGDNVLKIVLDGLQGVAFKDDKNVTNAQIVKRWSAEPRIEVRIREELE